MGLFGKKEKEVSEPEAPVAGKGTINGLTKLKGRGFIQEAGSQESLFFNAAGCENFEALAMGQNVTFMKERDPNDRLRMHAIEVRPA